MKEAAAPLVEKASKTASKVSLWLRRAGVFSLGALAGLGLGVIINFLTPAEQPKESVPVDVSGPETPMIAVERVESEPEPVIPIVPVVEERKLLTASSVQQIVNKAADLTTTRYWYKNASRLEDNKKIGDFVLPGTQSTLVFTYEGAIGLGIDLSKVEFEIDNDAMTIVVTIPDVKVVSNELDESSFEYILENEALFTSFEAGDFSEMREDLMREMAEEVMANEELVASASNHARDVIGGFLTSAEETSEYSVSFL